MSIGAFVVGWLLGLAVLFRPFFETRVGFYEQLHWALAMDRKALQRLSLWNSIAGTLGLAAFLIAERWLN
jgi:hypothetical protein